MKKNGKIIDNIGAIRYYKDDEFHREDGPAMEWPDGTKFWYINGKYHREDGPAVEYANGFKSWYLNSIKYHEEETYKVALRNLKLQKIKEILK
jgi:hypothetical protein